MYTKYIQDFKHIKHSLESDLNYYEQQKKECELNYLIKEYDFLIKVTQNQIQNINDRISELEVHQQTHERMI